SMDESACSRFNTDFTIFDARSARWMRLRGEVLDCQAARQVRPFEMEHATGARLDFGARPRSELGVPAERVPVESKRDKARHQQQCAGQDKAYSHSDMSR